MTPRTFILACVVAFITGYCLASIIDKIFFP